MMGDIEVIITIRLITRQLPRNFFKKALEDVIIRNKEIKEYLNTRYGLLRCARNDSRVIRESDVD